MLSDRAVGALLEGSASSWQHTPRLPFITAMVLPAANTSSSELGSHSMLRVYSPAQYHDHIEVMPQRLAQPFCVHVSSVPTWLSSFPCRAVLLPV